MQLLCVCDQCVCTEKDKERTQRHHDELVIAINAGKEELREKRKERGGAADANRKAGYGMHSSCIVSLSGTIMPLRGCKARQAITKVIRLTQ